MTADMIKQCTQELVRQKELIISELKLSEEMLLTNISQDPKLWNTECISIQLDPKKTNPKNFGLSASIKLIAPERETDSNGSIQNTTFKSNQEGSIDLTAKVRQYAYMAYENDQQCLRYNGS